MEMADNMVVMDAQELFSSKPLPLIAREVLSGMVNSKELMESELKPLECAIDGILPVGLTILGGAPKSGKSLLALDIANSVACGMEFLGRYKSNQGKVLYITYEDTERRLQSRLLQKNCDTGGIDLLNLHFHHQWPDFENRGLDFLEDIVPKIAGVKLVVIDTLGRFLGAGTKHSYIFQYQVMSHMSQVANRLGIALLVIHHTVKTKSRNWKQSLHGTNAVSGGADGLMVLERIGEGKDANLMISGRDIEDETLSLHLDKVSWRIGENLAGNIKLQGKTGQAEICKLLTASNNPLRVKDIAEATGKSAPNVSNMLKAMIGEGLVVRILSNGTAKYAAPLECPSDDQC